MSGYRLGFAGSLLLHGGLLGIWWALGDNIPQLGSRPVDQPLPLTLAMFQEAPVVRRELAPPEVDPVSPEAPEKRAIEPPHEQEAPKVQRPAEREPLEAPASTRVSEIRPSRATDKPSLQFKPKPIRTMASPASEAPGARRQEAKPQSKSAKHAFESRPIATFSGNLTTKPAAVVRTATAAQSPALAAAQQQAEAKQAAKLEQEYLERLWLALEHSKFYPRQARRRRAQGLVQVRFRVLRDGSFNELEVIAGSGSRLLDQAALQTLNKVSGAVPFPTELRKEALVVSLPITYRWR